MGEVCTSQVQMVGKTSLMELPKTSFLSSRRIAPESILKCYDWAIKMRDEGRCVISGFQSPLEKDVLKFLLKGRQPIVLVLARRMYRVLPVELRDAVGSSRMLIVSPVSDDVRRASLAMARLRNQFILEHSERHVFGSIDPEGTLAPLMRNLDPKTIHVLGGNTDERRLHERK